MPGGGLCLEPFAGKRGGRVRDAAHCPNPIPAKPETTARTLQLAVARRMGRVDGLPIFHPFILPVPAFGLYADRPSFYPDHGAIPIVTGSGAPPEPRPGSTP